MSKIYDLKGIIPSNKQGKKLMAVFINKKTNKQKITHFGSSSNKDYTIYSKTDKDKAEKMKNAYIARHKVNENWNNPISAGALAKHILWNKPTIRESIKDYKKRFNF